MDLPKGFGDSRPSHIYFSSFCCIYSWMLHKYGSTIKEKLNVMKRLITVFHFLSEKEALFCRQILDSQACQKHINDLFYAVSIIYISPLFLQEFNEEKKCIVWFKTQRINENILNQNICLQKSIFYSHFKTSCEFCAWPPARWLWFVYSHESFKNWVVLQWFTV